MNEFDIKKKWSQYPIVAFDTETSGPYPVESEIIEIGAVKWHNQKIVDRFQILVKPQQLLKEENIKIHGITNEMLVDAPPLKEKISDFKKFIEGSILLAHHAPFDLGFMTLAFEKNEMNFPETLNLCTSLISRKLLNTTNHKLQTLVKELSLSGGEAHRAFDDSYACLQVFFKSIEKISPEDSIEKILQIQEKSLDWSHFTLLKSQQEKLIKLLSLCEKKDEILIEYLSGQTKSKPRKITPLGIVRNPDGDYISAFCHIDQQRKRFYIDKIILS